MLNHLTSDKRSFSIGSVVLLDSELTMKQHINYVVSIGYYHLCRLRQLRRHITHEAMKKLILDTEHN